MMLSKSDLSNLAIVGSGPTALYLMKYIWDNIEVFKNEIQKITIFEKEEILGMGMPYHPKTTDIYNLANISSEEIPMLEESFADWLRRQDSAELKKLNVTEFPIDDSQVYSRIALGHYFLNQFQKLISKLKSQGIEIFECTKSEVIDLSAAKNSQIKLTDSQNNKYVFSTVVIANGHEWKGEDELKAGYYASPWPIHKLIPKENEVYNFRVGTLGSSLSAFDVVTSLSHRHGVFTKVDQKLKYIKNEKNPDFKIVLHSSEGLLPHLQYEQLKPIREIYRHFHREDLLKLIDEKGFMRIENFFDQLCRPALIKAFQRDKIFDVAEKLKDHQFSFEDLVAVMADKHQYPNSFEGMKLEMETAKNSVYNKIPIYWMETLDDLMYSLNYHAELLPAEDHLFFHQEIISFLMNVIAALPLQSAEILLALYDADCIELKSGKVEFPEDAFRSNFTKINVKTEDGKIEKMEYRLFVNCGGPKKLEINNYPFESLTNEGIVRSATAEFADQNFPETHEKSVEPSKIVKEKNVKYLKLSGIDIDSSYRTINKNGKANPFLYDINFTHTNGLRPYSYGLQACSATSLILAESWIAEITEGKNVSSKIENITDLYEEKEGL